MAPATEAPASITAEGPTSHTLNQAYQEPTPEQQKILAQLREPFDDDQIQYRAVIKCTPCEANGDCAQHVRAFCPRCQDWVSERHICLPYIGHADATHRLLQVDPMWSWEPVAFNERGLPATDGHGGLWIRLTVGGMTRLGYGDAEGMPTGPNAVKATIGDAIRNAAMRFGMALDLWRRPPVHKGPFDTGMVRPEVRLAQLGEWAKASWGQADRLTQILTWAEQERLSEALVPAEGLDRPLRSVLTDRIAALEAEADRAAAEGNAA
ncbi:hypothetical protein ABZ829_28040 [Streptomyces xanthochromogenes]|uniref:hypothetical protein n=1 Tax=Streptomyces xanthochromogenes TaxID=67384 RepID=UPI0034377F44